MNKKPRCYISGAITGIKHADKPFARAEEKLELEGYQVVNPYKFGEHLTQSQDSLKWTKDLNKARVYKGYREALKKSETIYLYQKKGTVLVSVELKIKE